MAHPSQYPPDPSDTQPTPGRARDVNQPQAPKTRREGKETAEAAAVYEKRIPTVEAIQFDGENNEPVIKFAGKKFVSKTLEGLEVRIHGEHPQSPKLSVGAGQWVVKQSVGTPLAVVNDGDFQSSYQKVEGVEIEPLPEEPEADDTAKKSEKTEPEKAKEEQKDKHPVAK